MKKSLCTLTLLSALTLSAAAQVATDRRAADTDHAVTTTEQDSRKQASADIEARIHILGKQMQEQREREGDAFDPAPYERRMAALRARLSESQPIENN
jgi:peptidoglycan hydrolase CwlO-like protein